MSVDKLAIAKQAATIIAGAGVSKCVNDIVVNNTTIETGADSAKVWVGSLVLGSMIAKAGSEHVAERFDSIVSVVRSARDKRAGTAE